MLPESEIKYISRRNRILNTVMRAEYWRREAPKIGSSAFGIFTAFIGYYRTIWPLKCRHHTQSKSLKILSVELKTNTKDDEYNSKIEGKISLVLD